MAEYTLQETLDLAAEEGIQLGHRLGRVTARGTSEELGLAVTQNERALVAHLGGVFYEDPLNHSRHSATMSDWFHPYRT